MEQAAQDFAQTYAGLLAWSLTWWSDRGAPGVAEVGDVVAVLRPVMKWTASVLLALALVGVGMLLAVRRRGADLAGAVMGLGRALLVVSAGWLVLASAWSLGDRLGGWIIGRSAGVQTYTEHVARAAAQADPLVALMLSIVGVACCLAFAAVLVVRVILAVVVAAAMPVLAAGSLLSARALRIVGAWAIAVVAFDPLCAVVYRVGHALVVRAEEPVVVLLVASVTSFTAAGMLPIAARVAGAAR